jgi:hypothetical protein
MRNRLIELLRTIPPSKTTNVVGRMQGKRYTLLSEVADYLLANGVIVPPCKIGDMVYIIDEGDGECADDYVLGVKVLQFFINENGIALDLKLPLGMRLNTWAVIGKNVFLTKEEAEKALAERSNR